MKNLLNGKSDPFFLLKFSKFFIQSVQIPAWNLEVSVHFVYNGL